MVGVTVVVIPMMTAMAMIMRDDHEEDGLTMVDDEDDDG